MTRTESRTAEQVFLIEALRAEAEGVARIAAGLEAGRTLQRWSSALDLLEKGTGHVVVSGMGKSGLVGAKISATFSSLGQPSSPLHPAEAVHGDLGRVRRGDVIILLSHSGETKEVVELASILRADGVPRLGISNGDDSSLARLCDVHIATGIVAEACPHNLAPTVSTTAQLAVGDALALGLARRRNFTRDDFHRAHPGGLLGAGLRRVSDVLRFEAGRNLPVLPSRLTVRAALDHAGTAYPTARRAGAVLLVDDDGRLAGIFTDSDLRRLLLSDPNILERPIASVMTPSPKHLRGDALVRDAEQLIREYRVDEIPVLDHDDRPLGLLDIQDLIALRIVRD